MNNFLVCWCSEGLEYVVATTEIERQNIINILSDKPIDDSLHYILNVLILRARANSQRFYEIYSVSAVDGITKEDIEEMFKNSPQEGAKTIRKLGQKIYSDRQVPSRIKIT